MLVRTETIEVTKKQEAILIKLAEESRVSVEDYFESLILELIHSED